MIYKCSICGYIFDEEKEGKKLEELEGCPLCGQPVDKFVPVYEDIQDGEQSMDQSINAGGPDDAEDDSENSGSKDLNLVDSDRSDGLVDEPEDVVSLEYPKETRHHDPDYRNMKEIQDIAVTGTSRIEAMGTKMPMPGWDDILVMGAQLNPMPLDAGAYVCTTTVIGRNAKKPMILSTPVYISHMSFGALSKEAKTAMAKGAARAGTAICSGEGGILPEEREAASKYIFEYVPNMYSVTDENLKNSDAVEIKIGQGTKPGMGGHLPGEKVTPEIAEVRGKTVGQDIISPSKFPGINTKEDLRDLVSELRSRSDGRPVGIKIAAGKLEQDLEYCVFAQPDFITIDGRGGATGASPAFLRDSASVPSIFALSRARKYLDSVHADIDLVITGGLRTSGDFVKAIAMGADAVAVASAAMVACGCQQYRICGSGGCPVGIATQNPELRKRLDVEAAACRVYNYLKVSTDEIRTFLRITGHKYLHELNASDLCTINREISEHTEIRHA